MDKKKQIEIFENLINIESANDHESKVADYIESLFEPYKDKEVEIQRVQFAPDRDNLVVTIGSGDKVLGFSGHEDVVSAGDPSKWNTDPYKATIKDGKLYGRGTTDMKSGLAALIIAMLDMLENDTVPGKIKLFATVGEETGEYGAAQLVKQGLVDGIDGMVIAEPSNEMKEVDYTSKGVIDYHVTSIGKSSHSARPQYGINAIDNLLDFMNEAKQKLATLDKKDPILGGVTSVFSKIKGGEQVNSVPAHAEMMGNIRTIPEYPNQVVYDILEGIINELNQKDGYKLSIEYSYPEEAMPGDKNAPLIKLIQKVHDSIFDDQIEPVGCAGASDGSEFLHAKGDFSIALVGPGNETSHQTNENIDLDVFHKSCDFYYKLAQEFFK